MYKLFLQPNAAVIDPCHTAGIAFGRTVANY
jgi:hypothetical protein